MPTIAERWIQQGIEQGIQQGLLLDAQEMLLESLEERFLYYTSLYCQKDKGN